MRILHVLDHSIPLHSGYTFRTASILREQRARGWETDHVTSTKHETPADEQSGSDALEEEVEGLHFFRTKPSGSLLERLPVLNQWAVISDLERRLSEIIPAVRPDIIHAHSPALNGLAAVRAARRHGIPVVYEVRAFWEDAAVDHGTTTEGSLRYRLGRALETMVFKRANAVTAIALGLIEDITARGIPSERITLIPNAVDLERFRGEPVDNAALRSELGFDGVTVLGFIGSFYGYEGLSLILDALPAILERYPDVKLLMVGGGFQEQPLKAQMDAMGLGERIVFTGRVPHEEVRHYYQLVDIFLYPRLPIRLTETVTPLKPLEAMAEGRLVVASDVGGHRELIEDGLTGVLFRAGSAEALAEAVCGLLSQRERWPALIENGRRFVNEERNWPAVVARYESVYESLLHR